MRSLSLHALQLAVFSMAAFSCTKSDVAEYLNTPKGKYYFQDDITYLYCYPFDTLEEYDFSDNRGILNFDNDSVFYPTDEDGIEWSSEILTLQRNYAGDIEIVGHAYIHIDMNWASLTGIGTDTIHLDNVDIIYQREIKLYK